jgi:hypothetical protein
MQRDTKPSITLLKTATGDALYAKSCAHAVCLTLCGRILLLNQQQHCVPQQMQQLQQGTSFYNQISQVQPHNHYTVHSNYIHPTEHQQ